MADGALRSLRFRKEREESWRRLEELLARVERRSATSLSDEDMLAIPSLYRAALSSLSVARATSLDAALIEYLEALCARAYFFVYGARTSLLERVGSFFVRDWPQAVRELWRETLVALLLMIVGVFVGYMLVANDPDWFRAFVPEGAIGDPMASREALNESLHAPIDGPNGLSVFATFLFTHNAQVALLAFALGFALCVPTAMLLISTGISLGAIFALFVSRGLGLEIAGWIFIHGVTELFAICLAGAAGFRIGWSIAFPGALSRMAAAARAGRLGGVVMIGVVVMLFFAGLLEGFGRQLIVLDWVRGAIALTSATVWGVYFYLFGRSKSVG
ncbi:MAG: stage II sporulation protein M [Terricaulis sp.]